MVDFYDIRIFRNKEDEGKKVSFDIDIISTNNAMLYNFNDDDYCKYTNSPKIKEGLILYKGQYYFFDQCLTDDHSLYRDNQYSYYVYKVRNSHVVNILKSKLYNAWLIKFESLYYYGGFYKVMNDYSKKEYFYEGKIDDDKLFMPSGQSPASLKDGITLKEFFLEHNKRYKDCDIEINNTILRRNKLNKIAEI